MSIQRPASTCRYTPYRLCSYEQHEDYLGPGHECGTAINAQSGEGSQQVSSVVLICSSTNGGSIMSIYLAMKYHTTAVYQYFGSEKRLNRWAAAAEPKGKGQ